MTEEPGVQLRWRPWTGLPADLAAITESDLMLTDLDVTVSSAAD